VNKINLLLKINETALDKPRGLCYTNGIM